MIFIVNTVPDKIEMNFALSEPYIINQYNKKINKDMVTEDMIQKYDYDLFDVDLNVHLKDKNANILLYDIFSSKDKEILNGFKQLENKKITKHLNVFKIPCKNTFKTKFNPETREVYYGKLTDDSIEDAIIMVYPTENNTGLYPVLSSNNDVLNDVLKYQHNLFHHTYIDSCNISIEAIEDEYKICLILPPVKSWKNKSEIHIEYMYSDGYENIESDILKDFILKTLPFKVPDKNNKGKKITVYKKSIRPLKEKE